MELCRAWIATETVTLVLGDMRKIMTVWYCHKIPRYDGIVIGTKF